VALRAVTGEIAARPLDTRSWGWRLQGVRIKDRPPFGCFLSFLRAGSVLSIQHLQKHWILERNRYLADLEIDVLATVVLSEGFSDHLGKCQKHQGAKEQVFQVTAHCRWRKG
jgi:hypothetical protein